MRWVKRADEKAAIKQRRSGALGPSCQDHATSSTAQSGETIRDKKTKIGFFKTKTNLQLRQYTKNEKKNEK
jgi:hypothetical protein